MVTKCQAQELELRGNEESIAKNHDLLNMLNDKYQQCAVKVAEADTEICKERDVLMKLDEELNFLETCNDRHKTSQAHLTENLANYNTYVRDNTAKLAEGEVKLGGLDRDEAALGMETGGLRAHTEELVQQKQAMQVEIGALSQHMSCLAHTNRALSQELDDFVSADDEVKTFLRKKEKVDMIKQKAGDELQATLSQIEARKAAHAQDAVAAHAHAMMRASQEAHAIEVMKHHEAREGLERAGRLEHIKRFEYLERVPKFERENVQVVARGHSQTFDRRSGSPLKRSGSVTASATFQDTHFRYLQHNDLVSRAPYQTGPTRADMDNVYMRDMALRERAAANERLEKRVQFEHERARASGAPADATNTTASRAARTGPVTEEPRKTEPDGAAGSQARNTI